jgi:hypothetical protein
MRVANWNTRNDNGAACEVAPANMQSSLRNYRQEERIPTTKTRLTIVPSRKPEFTCGVSIIDTLVSKRRGHNSPVRGSSHTTS